MPHLAALPQLKQALVQLFEYMPSPYYLQLTIDDPIDILYKHQQRGKINQVQLAIFTLTTPDFSCCLTWKLESLTICSGNFSLYVNYFKMIRCTNSRVVSVDYEFKYSK